ncbi:MAG: MurT ligase domain-containing protein [Clostridiaceae bacterium]
MLGGVTIKIKSLLAIIASKITHFLSKHLLKGGSNFPGKIALKVDPDILEFIAHNYKVILITGTNGKTTTTSMLSNALREQGLKVITNETGANMLPGIVACFAANFSFFNQKEQRYAVIEVDEANVKFITEKLKPEIITITNLFRDQLDRYGEVYTTLNKILEGIVKTPESTLVLNGDESLLGKLPVDNKILYYGFNTSLNSNKEIDINADAKFCKVCKSPYKYNFITYNHLGDFYCDNCGYTRPELKYHLDSITQMTSESSSFSINGTPVNLNQGGIYNIYNALCAFSIGKELGLSDKSLQNSLEKQGSSFGRQESILIGDKKAKIILVKNPAGYNQAIDTIMLDDSKASLAFLLNDNYADGTDISWIWDVHFEVLREVNYQDIFIGGERLYDMAVRLKTAGLDKDKFLLCQDYDKLTENLKNSKGDIVYILATYTAMINYRKYLHSKGFIKKLW